MTSSMGKVQLLRASFQFMLGVYIFANAERYEGQLQHGAKNGRGIYFYVNGNRYEGSWLEDRKNGQGTYFYLNTGEKYEGEWLNGEKCGEGVYFYAYGDKYMGKLSGYPDIPVCLILMP